jgi:hypothetical protein
VIRPQEEKGFAHKGTTGEYSRSFCGTACCTLSGTNRDDLHTSGKAPRVRKFFYARLFRVAAIVTAILSQFEDYSPAIQQFCLAERWSFGKL